MEVAPFFVDFHHFLSIFTIFCRFSRFTHFCRDLHFVAIYALFPQTFFGQNSHLRNKTHYFHVCKYPKLQLTQIYNNVRGEAERITPNYNYPKLQLPKLQLPQIYNYVCVIISWLVRLHGRSSTGGPAGDVRKGRSSGGPLGAGRAVRRRAGR